MKDLTRGRALAYLVAVFAVGLAAGGMGGFALGKRPPGPPPDGATMTERILAGLKAELRLSDEQVGQIRPLVESTGNQIHALHQDVGVRIGAIIKENNRRMEAFLTPEQRTRLADLEKRHDSRSKGPRGPGPGPGPDHGPNHGPGPDPGPR